MTIADEVTRTSAVLSKRLKHLDELLKKKGIDLEELEKANVQSVKFWQMGSKDAAGEVQVTDLAGITFSPSWESGPEWPVIDRGPAVKVTKPKASIKMARDFKVAVALPDMQMGYYYGKDDELIPTHDEAAINVARKVIREVQPDLIVMHGDNADFAEFSRFRLSPAFARTTQATIDRCTVLGAELREDAPEAKIVWLEGNHEARLGFYILDNAKAAFGLKRGKFKDDYPDQWPALSFQSLCRFDETDIEYLPGYPANEYWLMENLRVIHGNKVRSNGSTAHLYLDDARVSTLFGHVHRAEHAERTRVTRDGPRTIVSASAGCLCKIDGAVPSTKGGIDEHGQPVRTTEDWQQGFFVVNYQEVPNGKFAIERVSIWNGWAMWRGSVLTAGGALE